MEISDGVPRRSGIPNDNDDAFLGLSKEEEEALDALVSKELEDKLLSEQPGDS